MGEKVSESESILGIAVKIGLPENDVSKQPVTCPGCGKPYSQTPVHIIDTLPGKGLVAYCELCNG